MKHKRHRQPLEVMATMNITNLLDTAFILLITFMLVAPQLTHSIKITIPQVDDAPQTNVNEQKTILIEVQEKDPNESEERIYVDNERVDLDTMLVRVLDKMAKNPEMTIDIRGDEKMSFGVFVKILAKLGEGNIAESKIHVQPTSSRPDS